MVIFSKFFFFFESIIIIGKKISLLLTGKYSKQIFKSSPFELTVPLSHLFDDLFVFFKNQFPNIFYERMKPIEIKQSEGKE